jgi:hypothetical protein
VHEDQERVDAERHQILYAPGRQVEHGNEPVASGTVVEHLGVADRGTDPVGDLREGVGVGEVGGDRIGPRSIAGQLLGELVERFLAAGHEHNGVALPRVAVGDCLTEARARPQHDDRLGHGSSGRVDG